MFEIRPGYKFEYDGCINEVIGFAMSVYKDGTPMIHLRSDERDTKLAVPLHDFFKKAIYRTEISPEKE